MKFKIYIIAFFVLFFLSACVKQENYLIENINFDNYKAVNIDASDLIIDQLYISNIEYPYIDHLVKQDLIFLISNWAEARIKPLEVNNSGVVIVVINIASIKAFSLKNNVKIQDIFRSNAAINIEMNLDITINLLDKNGNKTSYLDLKVFKS